MRRGGARVRQRILAVSFLGIILSGCASTYLRVSFAEAQSPWNAPKEPYPYFQGTGFDAACVALPVMPLVDESHPAAALLLVPVCLVGLPLSAVLDTVLLPLDVSAHRTRPHQDPDPPAPGVFPEASRVFDSPRARYAGRAFWGGEDISGTPDCARRE